MQVDLTKAITLLKGGEVVAIPTETVYGLAADVTNENALRQIYSIKQRPVDNPLIVHIADASQVLKFASIFPPIAQKLAQSFWPGPFTLVLPAKKSVSNVVRGGQSTVALRVPNHPIALKLLQESGLALAAPSANKFTQLSPTSATHVTAGLGDAVPVLDGGLCKVGIESTIVSVDDDNWQLLRLGMICEQSIEAVVGKSALKTTQNEPKVPGQHKLHYSPITPIQLCASRKELLYYVETIQQSCAALLIGEGEHPSCQFVQLNANANDVAEKLYASLHALDALKVQKLFIEAPPNQEEWLAILDRLNRAAFNQ